MKIRKLYIHNIASVSDAVIEFDGPILSNEPLFLICGETGSGKTTILDAICLALYNDTPRLHQATRNSYEDVNGESITLTNPAQYLRKGTGIGHIKLSFEAGGKEYIAKWSITRAYKKADGKFQKCDWTVEDTSTQIETKGSDIAGIIGMEFEEFRRTVMLAQGEFTAFLKSKNDEKTRILEKITGTGIYKAIGERIGKHYTKAKEDFSVKNQSIAMLRDRLLGEEQAKILETEIVEKTERAKELETTRTHLDKLKNAKQQEAELIKEIDWYKQTIVDTKSEFSRLSGGLQFAINAQKTKEAEYEQMCLLVKERSSMDSIYKDSKLIVNDLSNIADNKKNIIQKCNESDRAENKCKQLEEELKNKEIELAKHKQEYATIKEEIDKLSQEHTALEVDKLRELKNTLEKILELEDGCQKLSLQINQYKEQVEKLNAKVEELNNSYNNALEIYSKTQSIFDKLQQTNSNWAKEARASLEVGDKCPVCGQSIPNQDYLDSISDMYFQSLLEPVRIELNEASARKDHFYKELTKTQAEINSHNRLISERAQELNDKTKLLTKLKSNKSSNLSLEDVNNSLEKAETLTKLIDDKNRCLQQVNSIVTKEIEKHGNINAKLMSEKARIKSIKNSIEETRLKNNDILAKNDLRMGGSQWRQDWQNDRKVFCDNLMKDAEEYLDNLEEKKRLENILNSFKETLNAITDIRNEIVKHNIEYGELASGECIKITNQLQAWNKLNVKISTAVSGITNAEGKRKNLSETISEVMIMLHDYFTASGIELSVVDNSLAHEHFNAMSQELSSINKEIGSKKNELEQDKRNRAIIEKDLSKLEELSVTLAKWEKLNDIFGRKNGEYFQRIAQCFVMNDILSRANHYLRTITKRYLLESQPGSLEILIRDLEQGGVVRSTTTISGGESFIISLALALGLSSLGAGGNIYVDTLFIDEGFGTLSGEYLDTVTETLQKLNEKGGKRVGIISHVKELRERIAAKIIVNKINPTESEITVTV